MLACRKCQKKLKRDGDLRDLARLKKTVKRYNQEHPNKLHVINVPCMDLCPKRAVTVCLPARDPDRLLIMGGAGDLQQLACHE